MLYNVLIMFQNMIFIFTFPSTKTTMKFCKKNIKFKLNLNQFIIKIKLVK